MSIFRFKARNQQKGTQKQQQQSPNATDKTKSDDAKQKFGAPTFLQYRTEIEEMFKADEKRLFYSRLISNGLLVLAVIMTIGSVLYMISELAMWSWSRKEAEEVLSKCGTPWKRTDCIRCIKTNDQQPVNVPMSRSAITKMEELVERVDLYRRLMFFNAVFCCTISVFVVLLIFTRTPRSMHSFRWYLLNIVFWSSIFDIYMSVFYTPVVMLPTIGLCSNGRLNNLTSPYTGFVACMAFIVLFGATGMSVFVAFLFRLSAITQKTHWLHRKSSFVLMIFIHVGYSLPTCVFLWISANIDVEGAQADIRENHPNVFYFSQSHHCLILSIKTLTFFISALIEVIFCLVVVFTLRAMVLRKTHQIRHKMSRRTYQLHISLTTSLSVQFLIPILVLVIPFSFLAVLAFSNQNNGLTRDISFLLMALSSMHSGLNAISMIFFTGPYRRTFLVPYYALTRKWKSNSQPTTPFNSLPQHSSKHVFTVRHIGLFSHK
ncbi:Serpentine Receptor, class H [Aphelenchoides besseyi]|nr:Serpentine Receptor, class H [Aphelenchoides besseyi]